MPKVLVDTDILSEYLKGFDQNAVLNARAYAQEFNRFTFASVTVYEIVHGLEVKDAWSQLQKVLLWIRQNEQIVPTSEDYLSAARVKATARKQGRIVELPDCLIASAASRLLLPLATGNDLYEYSENRTCCGRSVPIFVPCLNRMK